MNWSWLWWLGAALVLGVIEMITVELMFLMLAGGAIAGAIVGAVGAPFAVQLLVAAVVAVLLVFLVRPWALTKLKMSTPEARTNTAAHIGRKVIVISEVDSRAGQVKLAGETWTARSAAPGMVIPLDAYARVVRIEGATAIVEPFTESDPSQPYHNPNPGQAMPNPGQYGVSSPYPSGNPIPPNQGGQGYDPTANQYPPGQRG